jgi:hypothetical protein
MAFIVFGPAHPASEGVAQYVTVAVGSPTFGFRAVGSADEVMNQIVAGQGGFTSVEQDIAGGKSRRVYVNTSRVLWVADD